MEIEGKERKTEKAIMSPLLTVTTPVQKIQTGEPAESGAGMGIWELGTGNISWMKFSIIIGSKFSIFNFRVFNLRDCITI